ncbi:hypothetical protein ACLQ24_18640 [Micromonospora sp. DT4]|uniref:hypothetical protein n=1 Tax=Micromonospora sp. DT4 TaxID=3393438 RepID=UPI003CECAD16
MRALVPTGNQMNLGNLPEYWRVLAGEFRELESLPSLDGRYLLSARAFDEAQVAGPRTYMAVIKYLGVARDNHEALLALLKHHGATLWAPWSLLRPTFEAAFLAAWILDPDVGRVRRIRGLRSEVQDFYEQRKHRGAFKALPELRTLIEDSERGEEQDSLKTYRAEAAQLGEPFDKIHQRIVVTNELPKLSFVGGQADFAAFLEGTWRLLSGFEHGYSWALLRGTHQGAEAEIPGGASVHLVIDDDEFVIAAKTTYFLLACD